jgi:hypothetical protein
VQRVAERQVDTDEVLTARSVIWRVVTVSMLLSVSLLLLMLIEPV